MPCWSRLLSSFLLLAACAGTAPLPVISLTPEGPSEWQQGRSMLHQETAHGVSFWASFERDHGDYLEWWIRIENRSQRTLQVSPEYFFYHVAEAPLGGRSVRALDPTRAIARLDADRARADAREADAATRHWGSDLLDDVIDHMLGLEPPTTGERRHWRAQRRSTYLAERSEREQWRDVLANHTVQRSALHPGESVTGLVLFPRLEYPGRTELVLIVKPAIARFAYGGTR